MNIIAPSPILQVIYMLIDLPSHNMDNKSARIKNIPTLHIYIQSWKIKKIKNKINQWPSNFFGTGSNNIY